MKCPCCGNELIEVVENSQEYFCTYCDTWYDEDGDEIEVEDEGPWEYDD